MENGDRNRGLKGSAGLWEDTGVHIGFPTEVFLSPHTNIWSWSNLFLVFSYDTEMFCSEIYSVSLWKCIWGFQRVGLGFLLIHPAVNPRQDRKRGAAEEFGEGTLLATVSNSIAMQCNAICSRLCWQWCHRPKHSAFLRLSRVRAQAGEWWMVSPSPSSSGLSLSSAHCLAFPVLSSLLRITLTLACPMDLKNFPMDVQTCIMQLESCECCAHPHFGGETISFPSASPLPSPSLAATHSQPSLHSLLKNLLLGFSIHSAHVTFAREAKPPKIPGEESWLACVYIGLSLCRERWKCFQLQVGFFLSGWTSATCTCCLSQRRDEEPLPEKEVKLETEENSSASQIKEKNVICCRKSIAAPVEVFALTPTPTWTSSLSQSKSRSWQHCQGRPGCPPASKLSFTALSLSRSVFNVIHMTFVPSSQQLATQWMISYLSGKRKEQCKLLMGWHCLSLSLKKRKTWDTARSTTTQVSAVNP